MSTGRKNQYNGAGKDVSFAEDGDKSNIFIAYVCLIRLIIVQCHDLFNLHGSIYEVLDLRDSCRGDSRPSHILLELGARRTDCAWQLLTIGSGMVGHDPICDHSLVLWES